MQCCAEQRELHRVDRRQRQKCIKDRTKLVSQIQELDMEEIPKETAAHANDHCEQGNPASRSIARELTHDLAVR